MPPCHLSPFCCPLPTADLALTFLLPVLPPRLSFPFLVPSPCLGYLKLTLVFLLFFLLPFSCYFHLISAFLFSSFSKSYVDTLLYPALSYQILPVRTFLRASILPNLLMHIILLKNFLSSNSHTPATLQLLLDPPAIHLIVLSLPNPPSS